MNFLVAIKSCHNEVNRRAKAQRDTWLQELDWADYFFLVGKPSKELPDTLSCDVSDGLYELRHKIVCACEYALESNIDFMFVCDDDTYVRPDRLLAAWDSKLDYCGHLRTDPSWTNDNRGIPYAQGSAYWLSARAMEHVVKSPLMKQSGIEDGGVGQALDGKVRLTHERRFKPGPVVTIDTAPHQTNDIITTHKCEADMMRKVHMPWRKK